MAGKGTSAARVHLWGRHEIEMHAAEKHADPLRDVKVVVRLRSPSGVEHSVEAFWDLWDVWRARFSPDETGVWEYESSCTGEEDAGLHGVRGEFTCQPYKGWNPLYRRGELRVSAEGTHLEHADGTPFFWLACTGWFAAVRSDEAGWKTYLADRAAKRFTAIQFCVTQWRACGADREGQTAYAGGERIEIRPRFFQRLDGKFDETNERGLVAAPPILWAIAGPDNPGWILPESEAVLLARYVVARYGAHQVVWILAGDGRYAGERAERWRRIGRRVFLEDRAGPRRRLVTMHPCGQSWVAGEFGEEKWFDFVGYQSGHGDSEKALRWLTQGPPSRSWQEGKKPPTRPVINLEPNYEDHVSYQSRELFDDTMVRRAAYWSLLVSPPAGVTYGAHGVWSFEEIARIPTEHNRTGAAKPWKKAIKLKGSLQMKHLRDFFESLEWWKLRPAQELVAFQPGDEDADRFVAAAATHDRGLVVLFLPSPSFTGRRESVDVREVEVRTELLPRKLVAHWFQPATGRHREKKPVAKAARRFKSPGRGDWVLVIEGRN